VRRGASRVLAWQGISATILFLYLPLVAMAVMSFNSSRFGVLPFRPSLTWYRSLTPQNPLIQSALVSAELAFYVSITCAVVGTGMALWMHSLGLRVARLATDATLLVTLTVPVLILSVGMIEVFRALGMAKSALTLWLGCSVVSLPYTVFVVLARLQSFDSALISASRSLGAGPVTTFRRITLPLLASGIFAGSLMAFVVCFNNFTVQLFLAPVGVETLPVNIYSQTRVGITPDINAVSTIILAVTVVGVVGLQFLTRGTARLISGKEGTHRNG